MKFSRSSTNALALMAALAATPALAQQDPTGVWIDHTGRGAVEIVKCGDALCGHVVWVKDAKNKQACRTQIIGNVRQVGGSWDKGWIIDPDDNARYSVELKSLGPDRLRVTGYLGSKLFSETMTWRRAPADLQRCDVEAAKPAEPAPKVAATPPATVVPPAPAKPAPAPARPSHEQLPPIEATPLPPREAAAPPVPAAQPPIVAPAPAQRTAQPAPAPVLTPAQPAPEARPEVTEQTEEKPKPSRAQRQEQRQASTKRRGGSNRDCTLDLPYITIKYPCDAF